MTDQLHVARHKPALRVFPGRNGLLCTGRNGRVRIDAVDPHFASAVVADLGDVDDLPEGAALLRHGDEQQLPLLIHKPDVPTDPPNGWTLPAHAAAAEIDPADDDLRSAGEARGSVIVYDPRDWPKDGGGAVPGRAEILLTLLRHANAYAAADAERTDPS
jgi:hypothetical protein